MITRNVLAVALLIACKMVFAEEGGLRSVSLHAENYFDFKEKKVVFCVRNSSSRPVAIVRDTLPWIDIGAVLFDVYDYETKKRDEEWGRAYSSLPQPLIFRRGR